MQKPGVILFLWQLTALILAASILVLVDSQDQSDFISIDCGGSTSHDDETTMLHYVPDASYINSGESVTIAPKYNDNILTRFQTVRSFPEGTRNCYTLKPLQADSDKFLIRAQFMYGNYDLTNSLPNFDLYVGVNFWVTIVISDPEVVYRKEMIHTPTGDVINVCLVNKGSGTPFISVLELRPVPNKAIYPSVTGSMALYTRVNMGYDSSNSFRYDYDIYDRIWSTAEWTPGTKKNIETSQTVALNRYSIPSAVMSTALTPINPLNHLNFSLTVNPNDGYYFHMHFAEIETLAKDDFRGFDIYVNDSLFHNEPIIPSFLSTFTLYTSQPERAEKKMNFSLRMSTNSTLPPIINAIEVYTLTSMSQLETDAKDVLAMSNIKSAYNVSKIWQGDPCAPQNYSWDGLNCSFATNKPPRIISLDLSSSNLNGEISKYISDLTLLQNLDLSNNSLTGVVPDFLSGLSSLKFLDLSGNNLSGTIPANLAQKQKAGLTLNVEGNPHLCLSSACNVNANVSKKKSSLIPIIAAIAGALVLAILALCIVLYICRRNKPQDNKHATRETRSIPSVVPSEDGARETIESRNQKFTYSQVLSITNNFSRVVGQGGFGTVYHGHLDDFQVAVKMLSPSSSQGYKEFKAEAQILMRVHHRNLTSLVGYCDEGDKMGLIYEFMSQGDLYSHLSDKNPQHLTWEERLHILLDAAQGLEYLHNGCKPPLVHRDIKSTNILLNDKFEGKLADFGLSRACVPDVGGQADFMPTMVAGTPGYLDPEYYQTQQLNEKSDVFSFGVVLMEVITSKPVMVPTTGNDRIHISKWVGEILSTQGDVKGILDPRLRGDYDKNTVWKVVELAMTCVSHTSNQRPTMSEVVSELSQCLIMEKSRKTEGFTTDTMDSVEMVSLGMDHSYSPAAR